MTMLPIHKDVVYEDTVIYLSGNAYESCEFHRCVFVHAGVPGVLRNCRINTCLLHLQLLINDQDACDSLIKLLTELRPGFLPPEKTDSSASPPTAADKKV